MEVDEYRRTRRDDLREVITGLREQIRNLIDQLRIARETRLGFAKQGVRIREAAARKVCDLLDERDYLEKDLADRLREFNSLPMSPRERERLEAEVTSIDSDLEYFERHLDVLRKLRVNLSAELQHH